MADNLVTGQDSDALNRLKWQVVSELGTFPPLQSEAEYWQHIDRLKYDVAQQIGVPLQPGYNGDLPARQAGAIGGRIGGPIGGNMVRRMIALAQQHMATTGTLPRTTTGPATGPATGPGTTQIQQPGSLLR